MKTMKNNTQTRPDAVGVEVNMLYLMEGALMLLLKDIERRLAAQGATFRREKKQRFNQFLGAVRQASTIDDILHEDVCHNARNGHQYDMWLEDTNEVVRLMLHYAEYCSDFTGAADKVMEYMRTMPRVGILKDEDFKRFELK